MGFIILHYFCWAAFSTFERPLERGLIRSHVPRIRYTAKYNASELVQIIGLKQVVLCLYQELPSFFQI